MHEFVHLGPLAAGITAVRRVSATKNMGGCQNGERGGSRGSIESISRVQQRGRCSDSQPISPLHLQLEGKPSSRAVLFAPERSFPAHGMTTRCDLVDFSAAKHPIAFSQHTMLPGLKLVHQLFAQDHRHARYFRCSHAVAANIIHRKQRRAFIDDPIAGAAIPSSPCHMVRGN